jgi:aminoglycoside phosphotransferase (APT) family kinase protein
MESDERIESVQTIRGELWEDHLNESHRSGRLRAWVSSFHHGRLPCQLEDNQIHHGSYNAGLKFIFDDGAAWLLRFPRVGRVHDSYRDEKVAMEVALINLIRNKTTIPVPEIYAWGAAAENPLSLGPFIIMEFIQDGVSLNDLLKDVNSGTRLLRDDLSDEEMEKIYRQFVKFLLQLFKLDFDYIGNLDSPNSELCFPSRPLTWKVHDILQTGGVNTFSTPV